MTRVLSRLTVALLVILALWAFSAVAQAIVSPHPGDGGSAILVPVSVILQAIIGLLGTVGATATALMVRKGQTGKIADLIAAERQRNERRWELLGRALGHDLHHEDEL